jgi:G:T/U-mismatch repair DNA glycosylase
MMEMFRENHPYNLREPIPEGTRILVVGTAPPPRFSNPNCKGVGAHKLDFDFFYGSGHNYFWKWMNEIGAGRGTPLPSDEVEPEEYLAAARVFLKKHRIWMKDVLQTYQRKPKDPCSASDASLEPPRAEDCTNLLEVLKEHPSICKVVSTSELACEWCFMAMRNEKLAQDHPSAFKNHKAQERGKTGDEYLDFKARKPVLVAEIHGRRVCFFIAPSPGGGNGGLREDEKRELYKRLLFSGCD